MGRLRLTVLAKLPLPFLVVVACFTCVGCEGNRQAGLLLPGVKWSGRDGRTSGFRRRFATNVDGDVRSEMRRQAMLLCGGSGRCLTAACGASTVASCVTSSNVFRVLSVFPAAVTNWWCLSRTDVEGQNVVVTDDDGFCSKVALLRVAGLNVESGDAAAGAGLSSKVGRSRRHEGYPS